MESSRSINSLWARIDTYSPAAMEKAPATGWAPATPRISETLVIRPSLTPNTAARAAPPLTLRWCSCRTCVTRGVGTAGRILSSTPDRLLCQGQNADSAPAHQLRRRRRRCAAHLLAGTGEVKALGTVDADAFQRLRLLGGLHALGDRGGIDLLDEIEQPVEESAAGEVAVKVTNQRYVELDDVGLGAEDVAERCDGGPGIVDRVAHP